MQSIATSLFTDPDVSEMVNNESMSDISYCLNTFEDCSNGSANSFPNVSISFESSDNSEEVRVIRQKTDQIKQAIKSQVFGLRKASEKVFNPSEFLKFQDFIEKIPEKTNNPMNLFNLKTFETENNVEILHEIITNVRNLNKNLNSAKKSLGFDLKTIEELNKEQDHLKSQITTITSKITYSLSIETEEYFPKTIGCKCNVF